MTAMIAVTTQTTTELVGMLGMTVAVLVGIVGLTIGLRLVRRRFPRIGKGFRGITIGSIQGRVPSGEQTCHGCGAPRRTNALVCPFCSTPYSTSVMTVDMSDPHAVAELNTLIEASKQFQSRTAPNPTTAEAAPRTPPLEPG